MLKLLSRPSMLGGRRNLYLTTTPTFTILSQKRFYRGDSPEQTVNLSSYEKSLVCISSKRDAKIKAEHFALPADADVRRKRLIYRSKQRGWLEVDVLLGVWASENVPTLSDVELDQFEEFVNEDTIDIYNLLTLRTDVPEKFQNNAVVNRIQEWCEGSPLGTTTEGYKKAKTDFNLI